MGGAGAITFPSDLVRQQWGLAVWVLKQVAECGADEIGGSSGDLDGFYAGMLTGGNSKAGDRQVKSFGKQAEAGLVGPTIYWRGVYPEPQDTVGFADDRFAGCLRLKMGTKGGGLALLPNQNHQRSLEANSRREGTSHCWINWHARIATMGEISIPNRHGGSNF